MNFLARILRFLFWLLVLSWGVRLLRRIVGRMLRDQTAHAPQTTDASAGIPAPAARRLVRDPVCGTHVDETRSIPLREGRELLHFCSTACRDAYAGSTKEFAANG
jgi:YHS domain-containing protein